MDQKAVEKRGSRRVKSVLATIKLQLDKYFIQKDQSIRAGRDNLDVSRDFVLRRQLHI